MREGWIESVLICGEGDVSIGRILGVLFSQIYESKVESKVF